MEQKGILMMIWGKPQYGYMAHQLAMSLKFHSPSVPIHLITDHNAVGRLQTLRFFDDVQYIETPHDPAQAKIDLYDRLPFEHTLWMDADGLCLAPIDTVFDNLIADGESRPFRCFVHAYYNQHDANDMPLMVWARRETIWNHYGLSNHTLPATQSSLMYIRKSELSEKIYRTMQMNYANRIPLDQLKNKWGGGQPDELYLNVTLAQLGYDPACGSVIYFADDTTLKPRNIKNQYPILSLFGTAANVKPIFERFYDAEVNALNRHFGGGISYKWKNIKASKHANIRTVMQNKRQAFKGGFIRSEKLPTTLPDKHGKTYLFTSYFESGNEARQNELKTCLLNNLNNPEIDHVYCYSESDYIMSHHKLTPKFDGRPTYQDLIRWAHDIAKPEDIVIISNSDIYFDQTIRWPHGVNMHNIMIALSRWDQYPNGHKKLFAYEHSQDTWIFKGKPTIQGATYNFGLPGCDNRIAYDANAQGYKVINCAKDIITYHLHNTNHRSYTQADRLEGNYMPVYITSIRDLGNNKLLIKQPGKVGDIICVLPIAKWYADKGYAVDWLAPGEYAPMFRHIDYCRRVDTAKDIDYGRVIDLSFGLDARSVNHAEWLRRRDRGQSFVEFKYELSGVPISELRKLQYRRNYEKEQALYDKLEKHSYILCHLHSAYGTPVSIADGRTDDCVHFQPVQDYTIFDWREVIEKATEIHCIDSSLCNFVDAVNPDCRKYYYITDRVPMAGDRTILQTEWTTINKLEYVV